MLLSKQIKQEEKDNKMTDRALCIAIDGSDGSGKETTTNLLAEYYEKQGKRVGRISFPRYNKTLGGTLLYDVLKGQNANNYQFADQDPYVASMPYVMDRYASKEYLEELIYTHDVVIFDRYVESNMIHQGGKIQNPIKRENYLRFCISLEYFQLALPMPHHIIYLDLPIEVAQKRISKRSEETGEAVDVVEENIRYLQNSIKRGRHTAEFLHWKIVECAIAEKHELTREEVLAAVIRCIKEPAGSRHHHFQHRYRTLHSEWSRIDL
jgi:dTMP kinase